MAFRILYLTAYIVFIINIGEIFSLDVANSVVKSLFLASGFSFLIGREISLVAITVMIVVTLMIFTLGALTDFPDFQWSLLINALNQYIFIYLLLSAKPTRSDRDTVLISAAWFALICSALGLVYQMVGLRTAFPIEFNTGQGRFAGTMNAAFLGGFAMSGMLASLLLSEIRSSRYYVLLAINAVILVMTGARVPLLIALSTCSTAFFYSRRRSLSEKFRGVIIGIILAIVVGPIIYVRYASRLESSGSSGRDIMWPWLLELSDHYPDFGIGFGHQYWSTPREVFILFTSNAAHNDYLRMLVELGYFGAVVFYVLLIFTVYYTHKKWGGKDRVAMAAFLGFLAIAISDNALATPTHFLIVVVGMFAACVSESRVDPTSESNFRRPRSKLNQHSLGAMQEVLPRATDR